MGYDNYAGFVQATTGTHTGNFGCIYALADSSVTAIGNGSTPDLSSLAIPVRGKILGRFTSVTVNSGSVILYKVS
jgi:hypothetical protein